MTRCLGVLLAALCLLAMGGPLWAQCPPPSTGGVVDFGPAPVGTTMGPEMDVLGFACSGNCLAVVDFITGPNASDFVFVTQCNLPASTVQSCSDRVRFNPTACGPRVAFLVHTIGGCATLIIPLIGTGTTTPVPGPPLMFPSTLAGTMGACVDLPLPANTTASIVGPGNFSLTVLNPTTIRVCFTPLAAACGTVTSTLVFTSTVSGCQMATFALSGFACSFPCAIGLAGSASLSAGGRKCILESLGIASTATGALRCVWLECAACCARAEVRANRPGAQAVLDQINCLLAFFGCTGDLFVCP